MNKLKLGVLLIVCLLTISTVVALAEKKENINTLDIIRGVNSYDNRYVSNEIIVKFNPGIKGNEIANINSKHKTEVISTSQYGEFKLLKIAKGKSVQEMVEIYNRNPNVEYAEPNYVAQALMVPNDPLYYPYQWHLDNAEFGGINMESAWEISTGSNDVVVAVLDTGVAYETYGRYVQAPDLADTCFVAGYDFVNNDAHPNDDEGHGTHVTGTIAQNTNNSLGVAGIAFDTCIMPVKVLNKRGSGTYEMIANGIYFAANNGAEIISMSLSGSVASSTLEDALAYAYVRGVTIIASSGNGGPDTFGYPAAYDEYVIAVGATRYDEALAPYSSYYSVTNDPVIGKYVDITAPGGDMNVDQNGDGYGDGVLQQTHNGRNYEVFEYYFYQGTSMAAPHVSGVAALIIASDIATTPDEVRNVLESTAEDKGPSGWDSGYGHGIVDAHAALTYLPEPECINDSNCQTDGWYETGNTQWLSTGQCIENELKEEEYRNYYCSTNQQCEYSVTNTTWIDTQTTRDKQDGTECEDDGLWCTQDVCSSGSCVYFGETCDDEIDCTIDSCNESSEVCSHDDSNCSPEPYCGDTICAGISFGEDCRTCPLDCPSAARGVCCGDGKCDLKKGETSAMCPVDCDE